MTANDFNYFREGKLYQWDKNNTIFTISLTDIDASLEFCLEKKAMQILAKFDKPQLKLGKQLLITSEGTKVKLPIVDSILSIPDMEEKGSFEIEVEELLNMCNFVSQKNSFSNAALKGVHCGENGVEATDNKIAYRIPLNCKADVILSPEFIQALKGMQGTAKISYNSHNARAQHGELTVIGRLVDGKYPNLAKVYEKNIEGTNVAEFDRKEVLKYLSYSVDGKTVIISTNKLMVEGEIPVDANLTNFDMQDKTISFDYANVLTVLKQCEDDVIKLKFKDGRFPCFINDKYLILPVARIGD